MPNPTAGDVHVNRPLTNISIAYMQSQDAFIADRVFPLISVSKQSDIYFTYDRGDWNRSEMIERAPGTESAGGGYRISTAGPYYCRQYSFHKDIPDPIRANADDPLNLDREASDYVSFKNLLLKELLFASNYVADVWATKQTGVAAGPGASQFLQWNDAASTPIEDVRKWKRTMQASTGFRPNTLVLGKTVYDTLLDHPDIIDRVKYGQTAGSPAKGNLNILATLLEIERILVMEAIVNSGKEGLAEASDFIVSKAGLLCYSAPRPGLMTPSAGYTFAWTGLMGSGAMGSRIRTFRAELKQSDRVEIDSCFDMKMVCNDLGVYLATVVA